MSIRRNELRSSIRAELARRDCPAARLAPVLGVSAAGVSRRLTGVTPLTFDEVERIAQFLDLSVVDLIDVERAR